MHALSLWPNPHLRDVPSVCWQACRGEVYRQGLISLPFMARTAEPHNLVGQALLHLFIRQHAVINPFIRQSDLERGCYALRVPPVVAKGFFRDFERRRGQTSHSVLFLIDGHTVVIEACEPLGTQGINDALCYFSAASAPLSINHYLTHKELGSIRITPHALLNTMKHLPTARPRSLIRMVEYLQDLLNQGVELLHEFPGSDSARVRSFRTHNRSTETRFVRCHDRTHGFPVVLIVSRPTARPTVRLVRPHQEWFLATVHIG